MSVERADLSMTSSLERMEPVARAAAAQGQASLLGGQNRAAQSKPARSKPRRLSPPAEAASEELPEQKQSAESAGQEELSQADSEQPLHRIDNLA